MSSDSILLYFPWIEDATPWAKSSNGHAKKPKSNGSGTVLGKSWEISWHRNWNLVFMYTHAAHSAWIEKSPRQFEVIQSDLHESWPGEYKNGPLLGEFCENHSHPSSRDSRRSPVNTTGLPGPRCFNGGCGSLPVLWFLHVATAVYPLIVIIWFKTPPKKKNMVPSVLSGFSVKVGRPWKPSWDPKPNGPVRKRLRNSWHRDAVQIWLCLQALCDWNNLSIPLTETEPFKSLQNGTCFNPWTTAKISPSWTFLHCLYPWKSPWPWPASPHFLRLPHV